MGWAWKPERAPGCTNSRYKCSGFWCQNLLSKPNGYCMKCRRDNKNKLEEAEKNASST